jgi:hypothetical protein
LLILSFSLGWWSKRGEIDATQLLDAEDLQFTAIWVNPSRELADQFFQSRNLRTETPADFDYRFLSNIDVVKFNGKDVARLDFANGPNRMKIYVVPKRDFRLAKDAAESSHCTIEVVESPSKKFWFVIVYHGEPNKQLFMPRGVVG